MLMSDEGYDVPVSNLRLAFDDAGGPMSPGGPIASGIYAPALSDLNFVDSQADVKLPAAASGPDSSCPTLRALIWTSPPAPPSSATQALTVFGPFTFMTTPSRDTGTISGGLGCSR